MENRTNDSIRHKAFILFLENGYEATNIRDICKEVGIKASSLYFHYSSKQELFFHIYNGFLRNEMNFLSATIEATENLEPKHRFYQIYKSKYEFSSNNITGQKFLMRYHLFPPKEIEGEIHDAYRAWRNEENEHYKNMIEANAKSDFFGSTEQDEFFTEYKRFMDYQIYQMIITNIKMNEQGIRESFDKFWQMID